MTSAESTAFHSLVMELGNYVVKTAPWQATCHSGR
uniref:Uncharacterized protein n=1 Tax=Lepeophtheirus salmonis TaxID=72036 RepID=A0A0K2UJR7_LEPSM